jgi:transposase
VICRDRASAYAEGARVGAPDAVQVADRFHLWQNLGKAVERCVARHCECLRPANPDAGMDKQVGRPDASQPPQAAQEPVGRFAERARRHHTLVHDLVAQGHSLRGIARQLGWGFRTVHRYARAATWQELVDGKWQRPRPSKLDAFKPQLQQRWEQGCRNATTLHRELTALGYGGSYALVRDYLRSARPRPGPIAAAPPSVRAVTGWLTRRPDTLTEDEQGQLTAIVEQCPELQAAAGHIRAFGEMLTKRRGQELPAWIAAVRAGNLPGLASFAAHLEHDLDAVRCGLTMRWNSGPVEGRVNHIKMVKRQMFGRAGLPLLRKRILLTANRR